MYGVFIPSKKKPLKTFNCLRSASNFADQGLTRCVFDLTTGGRVNIGNNTEAIKRIFKIKLDTLTKVRQ